MATNPLMQTIEALAKEKGIEPGVVIAAMEEAVLTASRKYYKAGEELKAKLNTDTGQVELFAVKTIVDEVTNPATEISLAEALEMYGADAGVEVGYQIEFPKSTEVLGRIAAQTAKQVIFQKVREAERENVFLEFDQRVGEVLTGLVKRFEQGDMIVEIGRIEAILPRKEQSRAESYNQGDRVRAVIRGVNKSAKGPQVVLSRTDAALLIKLFEQEVPEIYDGTVMIRGAVREAGDRAKVAVYSRERDIDPVGACVGMKGTRVQAIIRELRAFVGSGTFLVGILAATAASVFPVMLRSVTDPAWSLTAYNSSVPAESLRIALGWWVIGFPLALLYFYTLFRLHRGKAVAAKGSEGY